MTKSVAMLEELVSRLREQALEMASLRAALDIQFRRIADMQAELDLLPHARRRRQTLRALLAQPPSHNGEGHA
jgi:hypothetical protein